MKSLFGCLGGTVGMGIASMLGATLGFGILGLYLLSVVGAALGVFYGHRAAAALMA